MVTSISRGTAFLAAVILTALLPCLPSAASEVPVVRIGVALSTSGELAESGKKFIAGIRLRMEDFNRNAAEHGYRLDLVFRDPQSTTGRAVDAVTSLIEDEGVQAIIGPMSTTLMLAMAPVVREKQVVLISPSVTSPQIGYDGDWCFRVLFDDRFQGVALARYVREKLGYDRAGAILNDRFAYAKSVFDAFRDRFIAEGGAIVAEEHYSWVADEDRMYDFSEIFTRIADIRPEIILLPVHSTEVAAIIRESLRTGVSLQFCGGDTWHHENVLYSSGNNVENSYFISGIDFDSNSPEMRRFLSLYDASNDPAAQPTSVLGYDALSLLIKAMENGHSAAEIHEGLYGIRDFEIATGTITIDPERGSEKSAFVHKIEFLGAEFIANVVDEIKP